MSYHSTWLKFTIKPNTTLWLSLFLDVQLHVQATVFLYGKLYVRFFFLLKKPHPWFYCIITFSVIPSRGFSSCRNPGHTLNYCWQKNHLSKYLHPSTILVILSLQSLCFGKNDMTVLLLMIFQALKRINTGVTPGFKVTFQSKTILDLNDKCLKFLKLPMRNTWVQPCVGFLVLGEHARAEMCVLLHLKVSFPCTLSNYLIYLGRSQQN